MRILHHAKIDVLHEAFIVTSDFAFVTFVFAFLRCCSEQKPEGN